MRNVVIGIDEAEEGYVITYAGMTESDFKSSKLVAKDNDDLCLDLEKIVSIIFE